MKWKDKIIFLVILFGLICTGSVYGDTGTYRILDYKISLLPDEYGTTTISYYQKWRVTGGNIPWVTVGLPNSDFKVLNGKSMANVIPNNHGGWSGVKIDLPYTYNEGEDFEIRFTVQQEGLCRKKGDYIVLDYIAGWYDRAEIDHMEVTVKSHIGIDQLKVIPRVQNTIGNQLVWQKENLVKGERFRISVYFPEKAFKWTFFGKTLFHNLKKGKAIGFAMFIVFLLILMVILLRHDDYGGGGNISGGGIGTGYTGGYSGCACACVSCACACACAGGGAAGCGKSNQHECRFCRNGEARAIACKKPRYFFS